VNRKVREQTGTKKTEPAERAERLPLDDVDPRILDIAFHAVFAPRSIAGKYQWDGLMYVILNTMADLEKGIEKISFEEFIAAFSKSFEGVTSENEGRLSVYFKAFAERLEYLENPRTPTNGDIAVDALQDAFMGLTSGQADNPDAVPICKKSVRESPKALWMRWAESLVFWSYDDSINPETGLDAQRCAGVLREFAHHRRVRERIAELEKLYVA
jgi:hypothetical protein